MKWLRNPWIWLGLFVGGGALVYNFYQKIFSANVQTPDGKAYELFIPTRSDYVMVGEQLRTDKLIRDPQAFHWVAEKMNYPHHVYPGRYIIEDGMSTRELVTLLRSGKQKPVKFSFVKFRDQQQLASHVAARLEMTERQVMEVLTDEEFLSKHNGLTPQTAMTIFIPNTYYINWNIKPKDFFERMFKEYKNFWNEDRNAKRQKMKLSRLEVMTLASIVEEESNHNPEKPRIAGVYLNRLRKKWPLEADPTVKYAVGDWSIRRVLNKHLQTDSPYNTYLYPGVPPSPICTPSIPSIEAVLNGERHKYMFFCASVEGDGTHHFSESLGEHNAYARRYHA
ncbi:MAG: endolytic transglycosylase MltG, partial [Bacteroidota bacterium]